MQPVIFNDLLLTVVDVITAEHKTNYVMEAHKHLWFEFNYISAGKEYTTLNGAEFLASEGEWYIVPPGVMHSHRHYNFTGDDGYCIRIMLEEIHENASYNGVHIADRVIKSLEAVRPYALKRDGEKFIESLSDLSDEMVQINFIGFLLAFCEEGKPSDFRLSEEKQNADMLDNSKLLVHQAILYMKNDHSKQFNVSDMSDSLYVSYRHLSRLFKEVTGFTLTQMLNEIKVEHAKKLLMETDKTLKLIAEEVGFENEFYLSKIFTKYAHKTPTDFRKSFKVDIISKMIL